jgi:hypothetical protein
MTTDAPPTTVTFSPNEMITGVWGNYGYLFASIYLKTSLGRTLGQYGGPQGGAPFAFTGPVYGFFGSEDNGFLPSKCISGLGAWTPVPKPIPPTPPVTPVTAWLTENIVDPATYWDDGPHPGTFHSRCYSRGVAFALASQRVYAICIYVIPCRHAIAINQMDSCVFPSFFFCSCLAASQEMNA